MRGCDNVKRVSFFLIIIVLILSIGSYILINNSRLTKETLSANDPTGIIYPNALGKDLGEIESIIEYGDYSVIGAHFPIFGIDTIDLITKDLVQIYIDEFKFLVKDHFPEDNNYKSELSIDYEAYQFSNNIVSIKFTILESMSYYAHPNVTIVTKIYDLKNKRLLELQDIMEDNYLGKISEFTLNYFNINVDFRQYTDTEIFRKGILPTLENYSNFILEEDNMVFIFQKYQLFQGQLGIPIVKIPYEEIHEYLNPYFMNAMPVVVVSSQDKEEVLHDVVSVEPNIEIVSSPREIDPDKPMVALTFDDGPNKKTTIPILDTLKEYDGVATFFVLGNRVPNNEEVLKRMISEGSEIGNHSFSHKQLTTISSLEVKEQMDRTQDAVMKVVGSKPTIMRPTYGSYNNNLKSQIKMPMILWSIDTLDWKSRDAEKITTHVLDNVEDGDIVLMHDIYGSTSDAVKIIVPELVSRGYQLVTISELYELRGEALEVGNIYNHLYK